MRRWKKGIEIKAGEIVVNAGLHPMTDFAISGDEFSGSTGREVINQVILAFFQTVNTTFLMHSVLTFLKVYVINFF